ncbi:hypothetical protein ACHAXR_008511 [Thalassiosira sp. AJA248-18]
MNSAISHGREKRRRTASASASINDLTDDNFGAIADFLPKTSRALLAVALTAPASSWRERGQQGEPNDASRAIISSVKPSAPSLSLIDGLYKETEELIWKGQPRPRLRGCYHWYESTFKDGIEQQIGEYYEGQWEILDFVDVEKSLASRLTDNDIWAILVCIDANDNLERLNLTHCFSVVGHGLEPLRSSEVLEKIDLGLTRNFEDPGTVFDDGKLSEEAVFDVINDILGVDGNKLWRMQVPRKWYKSNNWGSTSKGLDQLLERRNYLLMRQSMCCYFGLACYEPKDYIPYINESDDQVDRCIDCNESKFQLDTCDFCDRFFCSGECKSTGEDNQWACFVCGIKSCHECVAYSEVPVLYCETCNVEYCGKCRLQSCRDGDNGCVECKGLVFDELFDAQKEEIDAQKEEIERLRQEVEELRAKNEELGAGTI